MDRIKAAKVHGVTILKKSGGGLNGYDRDIALVNIPNSEFPDATREKATVNKISGITLYAEWKDPKTAIPIQTITTTDDGHFTAILQKFSVRDKNEATIPPKKIKR